MKKLMVAAAIVAAGAAMAVESQIVGYAQKDNVPNFSLSVAPFDSIDGKGIDIQSIVPTPAEDGAEVSFSDIQTFTDMAEMSEQYYYMTVEFASSDPDSYQGITKDGWYTMDQETFVDYYYVDRKFAPGEGFMFNNVSGVNAKFTIAGQVGLDQIDIPACANFSLIGNIRALKTNIQDIVPVFGEGVDASFCDLQTFTDMAEMSEQYYYMTVEFASSDPDSYQGITQDGWYTMDQETFVDYYLADREFDPGEGFMFNNVTGEDGALRFKAVVLDK